MASISLRTRVLWISLGVLALAAAMGVIALLAEGSLAFSEELLWTSITTAIFSLSMLAAGLAISKHPPLAWWTLAALALAYVLWIIAVWVNDLLAWEHRDVLLRIAFLATVPAGVLLHLTIVLIPVLRSPIWKALRLATAACSLCAGLLMLVALGELNIPGMEAVIGAAVLLALLGTVMVAVASALERSAAGDEHESDLAQRTPIDVICPRCEARSTLRANRDDACSSCGLRIRVAITEPRCACGYLLYNLNADVCPECGNPIEEDRRWRSISPLESTPSQHG